VQESGSYLLLKLSYGQFSVKNIPNFRYHGNKGSVGEDLTYVVKLADLENPVLGARTGSYLLLKPSYGQFCVEITTIGCHGNKGQSGVNLNDTIRLRDPENPRFGENSSRLSLTVPEL